MHLLLVTSNAFAAADRQILPAQTTQMSVRVATSGAAASELLARFSFDGILLCAPFEDCQPEALLEEALRLGAEAPVLVRNRDGSIAQAIRLVQSGACGYIGPDTIGAPEEAAQVTSMLHSIRQRLDARSSDETWLKILVGRSLAMQNVAQVIRLVASRRCNVLVTGETGTGKEMAARAIHAASSRAANRLVAVNCSALPENLLEAELFGHTKGAFTGAQNLRIGRFEEAHRSSLFLDEIADLPVGVQTKLLRILQEREVQRLGSSESIKVDFRLIAACNIQLEDRIRNGEFREDLYYRLNTVPLHMPALRDRREDIPLLVRHFLQKVCAQEGIALRRVSDETMDRLTVQNWPGNVRQLENSVEMAIALSGDREVLHPHDFRLATGARFRNVTSIAWPPPSQSPSTAATATPRSAEDAESDEKYSSSADATVSVPDAGLDFERVVADFEREIIRQALARTKGNKKAAADILRLKRTTLNAKLKSLEAVAS